MPNKQEALQKILQQGLLPLFFYEDPEVSLAVVKTLYRAGIRTLEYTNRGPAALDNFTFLKKSLTKDYPDLHLGIGTIKTADEARSFIKAGADYLVTPVVNAKVGRLAQANNLLWIPGCMTPTEIFVAQQNRATLIKLFPANILSPGFVSSIKELFSGLLFIPTGGVEIEEKNISDWFKSGVCAVGMGSKLISKAILEHQSYDELYDQTVTALEMVKACK
jgi:2-dehydro-3-deoxyphosphogluconate aldolase/(4S)-4-hydroxy-2-oxoglutarate aldolase